MGQFPPSRLVVDSPERLVAATIPVWPGGMAVEIADLLAMSADASKSVSAERRELELARDPVSAFLNGWTRKEAYVKALGLGLTAPLTDIIVSLSERAALLSTGLRGQSASNWRLLNVPHPRAVVAVALGPHLESAAPT